MVVIAYILAAILIVFGVLFLIAAFGSGFNPGWFITGAILVLIGLVLVWFGTRKRKAEQAGDVTLKIDLPANTTLDTLQCKNCGGVLSPDNVKMMAGAPVVSCPYCGTSYQLSEEPKW